MEDIEQKVIEIVSEQMGVDKSEITRETHFINDLNADSLDTVELVMEFEDEFELSIPDEEAEKIQTVGQAIDYIKKHTKKKPAAASGGRFPPGGRPRLSADLSSNMARRRVVITGLGLITSLGEKVDEVWDKVCAG